MFCPSFVLDAQPWALPEPLPFSLRAFLPSRVFPVLLPEPLPEPLLPTFWCLAFSLRYSSG